MIVQLNAARRIITALLPVLLGACAVAGNSADRHSITITSEPAGADVLADGVEIGITPVAISPAGVFRTGVTSGSDSLLAYRYIGRLMVRKEGCTDYVTEVDDHLLAGDIAVRLECDPDYRPPAAVPATQPEQPADAGQRLLRIEALHDRGLISDDEYQALRRRVLDTL